MVRSPSLTSTSKRSLRASATSRSLACAVQVWPSAAAPTCLTQISKPTVAFPSPRCSKASIAALRSIIAIIPGVERRLAPIVPPTSVSRLPSTTNSSVRSMPGSNVIRRLLRSEGAVQAESSPHPTARSRAGSSDHPEAARDAERLAGDEGGVIGGEEGDRRGHLLRPAEAAQLRAPLHRLDDLLADLPELGCLHQQRGLDRTGCDRIGRDPETSPLARHHLGEGDHPALRRRVDRGALGPDAARLGCDVDHSP